MRGRGNRDGIPPAGKLTYIRVEKGSFGDEAKVKKMLTALRAMEPKPALVIVDSFQFATAIKPTDPQEVTRVYGYLADFGTVLVLDHERAPRQGDEKLTARAFGSVYKSAAVDAHFHVESTATAEGERQMTIEAIETRDDAPLPAFGAVVRFAAGGRSVTFEKSDIAPRPGTTDLPGQLLALLQAAALDGGAYERQCAINQCGGNAKTVANAFTRLKQKRLVGSMTADGMTIWFATKSKVKR